MLDDFIDTLRNRGFTVGDEAFTSLAVDWLDEIDLNPALEDEVWLNARAPGINPPRRALYTVCTMRPWTSRSAYFLSSGSILPDPTGLSWPM